MNNYYIMTAPLEARTRSKAYMITAGFTGLFILIMILLKWKLPEFEKPIQYLAIEVELNLPEEPEVFARGGGGGGNPVQAIGAPGIASYTPPPPGENEASKDVEESNDKESPVIAKPVVSKPTATKITNTSIAKVEPTPVIETPAPKVPKAVLGKTTTGVGKGGGATDDFEKSGGKGDGFGVGKGNGTGGGSGNGTGGGNGTGSGIGNGPKVTRGDRKIIRHYSFEGDLDKAVVYANINVSPDGVGRFVSIAKGSTNTSNAYKSAIMQYLENIKFDRADHESMLTVQFNFRVN